MYSFDLDIIHGVNWDVIPCVLLDPLLQFLFILTLDMDESFDKVTLINLRQKLLQIVETINPLVNASESVADQV